MIEAIKDRFDQPGYGVYRNIQDLLLNVCNGRPYESELDYVCNFYKDDLSKQQLQAQLPLLKSFVDASDDMELTIHNLVELLSKLSPAQRIAYSNVWILLKLLLVMPATNATSERSFSALRRIKTYLRTTMTQVRLNSLMVLHIHSDKTDSFNLYSIGDQFVGSREGRLRVFGKFV